MEYTLKVTVSPTSQETTYVARVFVSGHDDERHVGTEQIWETKLLALDPADEADSRMWSLMLLREILLRLEPDAWDGNISGKAKPMSSLFEHQGHFIN